MIISINIFHLSMIMALISIVAIAIAVIVYINRIKKSISSFADNFADAIDEFNNKCNPAHPMNTVEWKLYESNHLSDFENASKVTTSKIAALVVKDLANAHRLIDIQTNHQAYMDKALEQNGFISSVNSNLNIANQSRLLLFDGKHYIAKSEADCFIKDFKFRKFLTCQF